MSNMAQFNREWAKMASDRIDNLFKDKINLQLALMETVEWIEEIKIYCPNYESSKMFYDKRLGEYKEMCE